MAEELALEQLARDRGAVDGDEGPALRAGSRAWIARATSSLPVPLSPVISTDTLRAATLADGLEDLEQRGARPTRRSPGAWPPTSRRSARTSRSSARVRSGLVDERLHLGHAEGLHQVVERAALHGLDGVLEGVLRGDDHHRGVAALAASVVEDLEAARARHADVEEGELEAPRSASASRAASPSADLDDVEALLFEGLAQHEADRRLVVGDENARAAASLTRALRSGRHDAHPGALAGALSMRSGRRGASPSGAPAASPRPVPSGRVVKKGVPSLSSTSRGMPGPRVRDLDRQRRARPAPPREPGDGRGVMRVVTARLPPRPAMAWKALRARLRKTWARRSPSAGSSGIDGS